MEREWDGVEARDEGKSTGLMALAGRVLERSPWAITQIIMNNTNPDAFYSMQQSWADGVAGGQWSMARGGEGRRDWGWHMDNGTEPGLVKGKQMGEHMKREGPEN